MIDLDDLIAAGGALASEVYTQRFADFSYDSRLTRPGELFLALQTTRADGHDYIPAALAAGAAGVLCTWVPRTSARTTIIQTDNPEKLVQRWAARRLSQVDPAVVAVTGSVGKTSTCRAIATLLAGHAPTFASRQSFNSLFGLPIALARLRDNDSFAVLEFGSDQSGEIAQLAALFPPRVAVVTSVGAVHLNAFGSLDGVAREKGALLDALPPRGWAILNGDDPHVLAMREQTSAHVLTTGTSEQCDLVASEVTFSVEETRFRLRWRGSAALPHPPASVEVTLPLLGGPAVSLALAAAGAALACGLNLHDIARLLAQVDPLEGRLRPLPGRRGAALLDDTISASLPSVLAALHTLAALPARRRIVVLGDLDEPAPDPRTPATEIGTLAGEVADVLIYKGDHGTPLIQAARQANPALEAHVVYTATAALLALPPDLGSGDRVLVKGGAAARMERIVAGMLAPEIDARRALVRQEPAWRSVRVGAPDRPTWIRVDMDAVAHNVQRLRAIAGVPLMVVVKADAYGHGAVRVGRAALASGAHALAVATLSEARALREADITAPILVLGYTPPWQAREAVLLGVTCALFDFDVARAFSEAAAALQREMSVHVKVDTGMGRLGVQPEQAGPFLHAMADLPALRVEGLYSHFATADSSDETFARSQFRRFAEVLAEVTAAGLRPPLVHMANSAAILRFPEARFDMARPGIACYGLSPAAETPLPPDFRPVLSFHTSVAQVKELPAGASLSYGGTFTTQRPSLIATIPVGYADGFRRSPPWREVLLREQRAAVVGRICMDYALLDVTDIEGVKRGDAVTLIGQQGSEEISADEVAAWLDTINYEVVSAILPRVPREVEA
jgi:alanine racemase